MTNEQKETAAAKQKSSLNEQPEPHRQDIGKETNFLRVEYTVNKKWQELIPIFDSAGVPINKTVKDLLKLYPREKVESA